MNFRFHTTLYPALFFTKTLDWNTTDWYLGIDYFPSRKIEGNTFFAGKVSRKLESKWAVSECISILL